MPLGRRRHSTLTTQLPKEIRLEVDRLLCEPGVTYDDIQEFLKERGHDISRSAIGRYGKQFLETYQQIRIIEDQARAIVSETGDGLVIEETASKLFSTQIVKLLLQSDVDVRRIPRLVSDFAKLQQSSVQRERFKAEIVDRVAAAVKDVDAITKKAGLSDEASAAIRRKILGIPPK